MRPLLAWLSLAVSAAAATAPTIANLSPNPVDAGGDYYPLTITGTGFQPYATVSFNGHQLGARVISSTQVLATVSSDERTLEGIYTVAVINPDGGVAKASATVSPVLLTVTPPAAMAGSAGITIAAKGAGLTARIVLVLNSGGKTFPLPTTWTDSTTVMATISASALAGASAMTIQAFDPMNGISSQPVPFDVLSPPAIASAAPNPFDAGGVDFFLTVTGSGFLPTSTVSWNGAPLGTTYVSPASLKAEIGAQMRALSGTFQLQVTNPMGPPSNQYPVTVSPVLFGISPGAAAAAGPAVTVAAAGLGFTRNSVLLLSQAARNPTFLTTTYVGSTSLTAVIPAAALRLAGPATIQVVDSGGTAISLPQPFTITEAVPAVSRIVPASATAGSAALQLSVTGANFAAGSVVEWNGSPLPTGFVGATQLTATVSAAQLAAAGAVAVTVVNAGGTASGSVTFTVNPPPPAITSVSPTSVPVGTAGFTLTVNGANFLSGATVLWNGAAVATAFVSAARLIASVPGNLVAEAVSASVSVANPGGAVSNSMTVALDPPAPSIHSVSPAAATAGGAGFVLTVAGLNFAVNSVVRWNGTPLATTFVNAAQVLGLVTPDAIAVGGAAKVTLTNPSGLESNAVTVAVTAPAPSISLLSPVSIQAGTPGLALTVSGANFLVNSAVVWNATALPSTRVSATQMTATIPASLLAAAGSASVKVATPGASDSNAMAFTIDPAAVSLPPPTVTSGGILNAASGTPGIAPGSLISIFGLNFGTAPSAAIDGMPAPTIFASPLQLNVQVPFETKAGTATLVVQSGSLKSVPVSFPVSAAAPGVFALAGGAHAIAQNLPDLTLNSADAPAAPGQYVTVYLTGQGAVDPAVATGAPAPSDTLSLPVAGVAAWVDGQPAQVVFAGLAPGFVGLLQMNILVPDVPPGERVLDVTIGGAAANRTILSVGN